MAKFISNKGRFVTLNSTLDAQQLEHFLGTEYRFHELPSGDFLICAGDELNTAATSIAGKPIYGDCILCESEDLRL